MNYRPAQAITNYFLICNCQHYKKATSKNICVTVGTATVAALATINPRLQGCEAYQRAKRGCHRTSMFALSFKCLPAKCLPLWNVISAVCTGCKPFLGVVIDSKAGQTHWVLSIYLFMFCPALVFRKKKERKKEKRNCWLGACCPLCPWPSQEVGQRGKIGHMATVAKCVWMMI